MPAENPKAPYPCDPACLTLAEHFLPSGPELEPLRLEMAGDIQKFVEDWLESSVEARAVELGKGQTRQ